MSDTNSQQSVPQYIYYVQSLCSGLLKNSCRARPSLAHAHLSQVLCTKVARGRSVNLEHRVTPTLKRESPSTSTFIYQVTVIGTFQNLCLLDEATGSCRPPRFYTLDHYTIWAPIRIFAVEREPKTGDAVRFRTRAGGARLGRGQAFDLAIRCQYKF